MAMAMAMAMPNSTLFLLLVAVSSLAFVPSASSHSHRRGHDRHHSVGDVCSITLHRSLCVHSLAPFSHYPSARRSTQWWTRAAVSVTLAETERVRRYVEKLRSDAKQQANAKGLKAREALSVCVECLGDAMVQLRQSSAELQQVQYRSGDFDVRMNDVATGVSTSLTDQETCREGLAGWKSPLVSMIDSRVLRTTYYSSNALALINKMVSEGGN